MRRIFDVKIVVRLFSLVGAWSVMGIISSALTARVVDQRATIETLRHAVETQTALREQAEQIHWKLVEEKADEWCEDTVRDLIRELDDCEWGRMRFDCDECWAIQSRDEGNRMETFCEFRYLEYHERVLVDVKREICE